MYIQIETEYKNFKTVVGCIVKIQNEYYTIIPRTKGIRVGWIQRTR